MKQYLVHFSLFLFLFAPSVQATEYACPLEKQDITGIMQWNDGFPMNAYDRHSHCRKGSCDLQSPIDINAFYGSYVRAPVSGQVVHYYYGSDSFLGGKAYSIGIKGNDGLYYKLSHIKDAYFTSDTKTVIVGQRLGRLVTRQQAASEQRVCAKNQEFTSSECIKVHLHFEVYIGNSFHDPMPSGGRTPAFLRDKCGISRPADRVEFPNLPTLNCAKILGNPNIDRCFMQNPLDFTGDDAVTIDDYRLVVSRYSSYSLNIFNRIVSRLH